MKILFFITIFCLLSSFLIAPTFFAQTGGQFQIAKSVIASGGGASSDGSWRYLRSSDTAFRVYSFGIGSDIITPGDFTGDGKADSAVFRPSTRTWFIQRSEDNSFFSFPFGALGDIPAPGDYDGDGKTDAAGFRPSTANWFAQRSTAGILIVSFGSNGDRPECFRALVCQEND